jgi:hypothetical protein
VHFVGECGHASLLRLHFHKGVTLWGQAPRGVAADPPIVIWRD